MKPMVTLSMEMSPAWQLRIIAGLPAVCQWKYDQLPAALKLFSSRGQSEKKVRVPGTHETLIQTHFIRVS